MSKTSKKSAIPPSSGSKLWAIGFAVLALVGFGVFAEYWLISVGILAFLLFAPLAVVSYAGKNRLHTFFTKEGAWRFVLPIAYLVVLTLVPVYGEPLGRLAALEYTQNWKHITKDGTREQNPRKLNIMWIVDDSKFTDEQKKLLKRWNPLLPDNDAAKKEMLSATWLQGVQSDLIVPFDSTKVEEGDPLLMIIFDDMQETRTIPPEDPKKDEPTVETVSYLKVTFYTPIITSTDPVEEDEEKEVARVQSNKPRFNTYTTILTDLNMSVHEFISDGLARSMRGEKGEGQDADAEEDEEKEEADAEDEDEGEGEDDE